MSRGELNQLVGEEEAERDIKKGKYIELQDEWGDKIYIKKTTTVTREKNTEEMSAQRQKLATQEEIDEATESFNKWIEGTNESAMSNSKKRIREIPQHSGEKKKKKNQVSASWLLLQTGGAQKLAGQDPKFQQQISACQQSIN